MIFILLCALNLCVESKLIHNGSFFPVNWTTSGAIGQNIDSHNQNPAVIPMAPCPCDLTSNNCDVHCCCDQDCKWSTPEVFKCNTGVNYGQSAKEGAKYNCAHRGPYSPQWFSFLCYEKENNPYLGMYFKFTPKVSTYEEYLSRGVKITSSFEDETRFSELNAVIDYKEGSVIQTKSEGSHEEVRSHLTLPMSVIGTFCTGKSVLQFLQNFESSCHTKINRESCQSSIGSHLSAASYLYDSSYIEANPEMKYTSVIGNLSSNEVVNVTMTYNCLSDIRSHLKVQLREKQPSRFSNVLKDKELIEDNCGPDSLPIYNATTDICENVVLAVTYEFQWRGSSLTGIVGQIHLGNLPLYSDVRVKLPKSVSAPHLENSVHVIQYFTSVFQYDKEQTVNTTNEWHDNSSFPNIMERSGNPFYDINSKVLTGYLVESIGAVENDTAEVISSVDVTEDTGLYVWEPGPNKLCSESSKTPVKFGIDTLTMCSYTLSYLLEDDCASHISEIESILESLIVGDMVSTIGWPNVSSTADFIPILSSANKTDLVEENRTECHIPVGIEYQVAFRDIDIGMERPTQFQIIGILVRFLHEDVPLNKETKVFLKSSVIFVRSKEPTKLSRFWQKMADPHCVGGICWRNIFYLWANFMKHATYTTSYTVALVELYFQTFFLLFLFIPILYLLFVNKLYLSF
ncbi:tectonic-2-like [Oratosquilla oratoria]|uniref:tectonic-2-like n=1 Tax=Oratosquilla oratoria TaxID=337810 RepID=UPI003F75FBB8